MKSPLTHFIHAQHTHCSSNFIQLHIPSSWIKLSRTVHHQGTWKPAQLLWIFDIFDSSLPACPSPEMLCSVLTSKLVFPSVHQCASFPQLSQCLFKVVPGAPNLPFSQLQNSTFDPTQSLFPAQPDCPDHHIPLGTPFLSWTPPKSCFSLQRGFTNPAKTTQLAKNPSRL